jgi:tetraacyldisaccharide-1-P 4'-kinase
MEIDAFSREATTRRAVGLITTAKDAIKLGSLHCKLPCYVLDIQIEIDDADRLVEMIGLGR